MVENKPLTNFLPKYFYHLAHRSNLDSIRKLGLISTTELLKELDIPSERQEEIIAQQRPKSIILQENLIIRDQSPMPPTALAKTLPPGVMPSDWYRLMNSFVFLWPDLERVERHRAAHSKDAELVLLIFDAEKLITDLSDHLYVSPINSGFALRKAAKRSKETTFVPWKVWCETGWPIDTTAEGGKPRPRSHLPVEIAFQDTVLCLEKYLVRVE